MPDPNSASQALHSLRDILVRDKLSGKSHVTISRDGLDRLRALPGFLAGSRKVSVVAETIQPAPSTRQPSRLIEKTAPDAVGPLVPIGATRAEKIAWLARHAESCDSCRSLGTLRDTMVFSVGNPDADLMFVGEAPGFEEERQREPFVGPAGQKLTDIIRAMGLRRPEDVYISNIVKFRPLEGDARFQGTRNRKPHPIEMATSLKYVLAEIEVVRPKVIVALGATATEGLLEVSGSVGGMRGRFYELKGVPVMVTYHPSYLLRVEANGPDKGKIEKRKVWEDMLQVMERLGLPITDRQRRYFA